MFGALDIDHLIWSVPDLDVAVAMVARVTGVHASPGGAHPGKGTRNALVSLGHRSYLEIMGPDPAQDGGAYYDRFVEGLVAPNLSKWVMPTADADVVVERAEAAGIPATVERSSRVTPDGGELSWTLIWLDEPSLPELPLVIDWGNTPHPGDRTDVRLELVSFRVETPDAGALRLLLDELGIDGEVVDGPESRLVAVLRSADGEMEISGSPR